MSRLSPLYRVFSYGFFAPRLTGRAGAPRRQSRVGSAALGAGAVLVRRACSRVCRALLAAASVRGGAEPSGAAVSGLAPRAGPDEARQKEDSDDPM